MDEERRIETYGYSSARRVTDAGGDGWFATPGGPGWDVFSLAEPRRVLKNLDPKLAELLVDDHNQAEYDRCQRLPRPAA